MAAYLYRMPSGIPGATTRDSQSTIDAVPADSAKPFSAFGLPGKVVSGKFVPIEAGDAASVVAGFLVRPYPTGNTTDGLGVSTPTQGAGMHNVLRRGYQSIKNNAGTPAMEGQVYMRVGNASAGKPIGGLEAASEVAFVGGTITGTGTGTISGSATAAAVPGTYKLTLQSTSSTSAVTVIDPNGRRLADAVVGTAYSNGGISFTITAGGTMTAGDSFSPVVTQNTVAVPGAKFAGAADSSGNVEIAYNI